MELQQRTDWTMFPSGNCQKEQLATTLAQYWHATHGNWRELVENKSPGIGILHQAARESGATDRPMRKPPRNPEGPPAQCPVGFGAHGAVLPRGKSSQHPSHRQFWTRTSAR